jgi:esterase/lipase
MNPKLLFYIAFFVNLLGFQKTAWADLRTVLDAPLTQMQDQLDALESVHPDIVENTEKRIRFYDTPRETLYSIVYLHGFSATRMELNPLVDRLADSLKANVYYTRLRGHGRSADAMLDGTVQAWKQDTLDAFKLGQRLGQHVVIIGTSTGGTLATWLNAHQTADDSPFATVLISPNFGVKSKSSGLLQWQLGRWLIKQLKGDYHAFKPHNEFHATYWTERYPFDAIVPMLDLVDEVNSLNIKTLSTPHLIVYSPNDQVVDVDKILEFGAQLNSEKVVMLPFTASKDPAQHVLVGDASSPDEVDLLVPAITSFVMNLPLR